MGASGDDPASTASTERAARAWDWLATLDHVRVVRPSEIRAVIRIHTQPLALEVPHAHSLVIERRALERIVAQHGLLIETEGAGEQVLLVADPGAIARSALPDWVIERRVLAATYHAHLHLALERLAASGRLDEERAAKLLGRLGHPQTREALRVLAHADELVPPRTAVRELIEIVARALELHHVAPALLPVWFPSLGPGALERVCARLEEEAGKLEPRALLGERAAKRLEALRGCAERDGEPAPAMAATPGAPERSAARAYAALEPRPAAAGHDGAGPEALAERLVLAIGAGGPTRERWLAALAALSLGGSRSRAHRRIARDLERVCREAEQPGTKLDLIAWAQSLGKLPLRRVLTDQVPVRVHRYLRAALGRARKLVRAGSGQGDEALCAVLEEAIEAARARIRARFPREFERALDAVGLCPRTLPERVARDKVVDELVDRVVERDYVSFTDLRDEISRNDLKLRDLEHPLQLFSGDALLRADRRLVRRLPGVYRSSTFYMRFLQRTSSLFFGTALGRLLVRVVGLPFGIAIMGLEGLQHMLAPLAHALGLGEPRLVSRTSIVALGLFLLAVFEHAAVRRAVLGALIRCGRALRWLCWTLPRELLRLPWLERLFDSWLFALLRRGVIRPAVVLGVAWLLLRAYGLERYVDYRMWSLAFVLANLGINSRFGVLLEAELRDTLLMWWGRITRRLLPELARALLVASRQVLGFFERLAYAVEEGLRTRRNERGFGAWCKAVAGRAWALVMYLLQFVITLLIEPQINPIKHFPVVTVSHKLLLPTLLLFIHGFEALFEPALAKTLAATTVFVLPGFFGFLVWELNANYRLYAASREAGLRPRIIGAHGERMPALVRPGFHSGTLPKAYEQLRRWETEAWAQGQAGARRTWKARERLEETRCALYRFWARELVRLLAERAELPAALEVRTIALGRYRTGLALAPATGVPLWLWLEDVDGWLIASIAAPGFAAELGAAARASLADALLGCFVRAQVDAIAPWQGAKTPFVLERELPLVFNVREAVLAERRPPGVDLREVSISWRAWEARWRTDRPPRVAPAFVAAEPIARALLRRESGAEAARRR